MLTPNGVNFEVQVLMDIKKSMVDLHGVLNWDENYVSPCGWTMICFTNKSLAKVCQGRYHLVLGIWYNSLVCYYRTITYQGQYLELGQLPKLQELDLSDNLISREIPHLSHLRNLKYMRMYNNSLAGPILQIPGNVTQLTFLDLLFNNLSGPVPKLLPKHSLFLKIQ